MATPSAHRVLPRVELELMPPLEADEFDLWAQRAARIARLVLLRSARPDAGRTSSTLHSGTHERPRSTSSRSN